MQNGPSESRSPVPDRRRIGRSPLLPVENLVNALILFVGWCILFVVAWPVALLALLLFPFVWLIALPFRLLGIAVEGVFALLRAILFLPARLLGHRG
jgi:hypothetical protein